MIKSVPQHKFVNHLKCKPGIFFNCEIIVISDYYDDTLRNILQIEETTLITPEI